MAYFPEDVKIEMEVVDGVEDGRRDLVALVEVAEVGPGEPAAGGAAAGFVDGPFVPGVLAVLDGHPARAREQGAVAGVARRQDTVEEIDAAGDGLDHVLDVAHAHEVSGPVGRQQPVSELERLEEPRLRLADAQAAVGVAVEALLRDLLDRSLPEVGVDAALGDAPELLPRVVAGEGRLRAPAQSPVRRTDSSRVSSLYG
jgi:hypothetical protein